MVISFGYVVIAQGRQVYTPPSRGLTRSSGACWGCFRSLKVESQSHPPMRVEEDQKLEYEDTILLLLHLAWLSHKLDQPLAQQSEIKSRNTRAEP